MIEIVVNDYSDEAITVVYEFERGFFWPVAPNGKRAPISIMRQMARCWRIRNLHPRAVASLWHEEQETADVLADFVSENLNLLNRDGPTPQLPDVWQLRHSRNLIT